MNNRSDHQSDEPSGGRQRKLVLGLSLFEFKNALLIAIPTCAALLYFAPFWASRTALVVSVFIGAWVAQIIAAAMKD